MLINSSNRGNRLKRVHFLHGECQLWLWLLLFPFFRKLLVCVIVSVWKVMKLLKSLKIFVSGTLSVFVLFSHSCNATVCSLIKLLSANSLRSNHLIGSRKNYNYVINKSCSGLRGNILYFIYLWHLGKYLFPIYWWLIPQKSLLFQHSKNHLNYLIMCQFLPLFLL